MGLSAKVPAEPYRAIQINSAYAYASSNRRWTYQKLRDREKAIAGARSSTVRNFASRGEASSKRPNHKIQSDGNERGTRSSQAAKTEDSQTEQTGNAERSEGHIVPGQDVLAAVEDHPRPENHRANRVFRHHLDRQTGDR